MRNLALIGGGYWGKNLIRDFDKLDTLHTICDINTEALKSYNEKYPNVLPQQIGVRFCLIKILIRFA